MADKRSGYNAVPHMRRRHHRGGQDKHDDGLCRSPGSMPALMREYLQKLQVLNYSLKTQQARTVDLRHFLLWAQDRDLSYPHQITRSILEGYQRHLYNSRKANGKPLSVTTQRGRLGSLKSYFSWLCRDRYLEANPASELVLPRGQRRLPPEPLTPSEVAALLSVPDVSDPLGIRDRAILEVFYSTGIRRTELCRLELANLNREKGVLFVRYGKGGKDRVVPVGNRALDWLETYLDRVRPLLLLNPDEQVLFITGYGGPFNPDVLSRRVTSLMRQAEIGRSGSCHLLRHTCATHLLDGGAGVRHVQELLGHSNLDTTALYTRISIEALKAVHARCHPAEKQK